MIAYKIMRRRIDGTYGSLFIGLKHRYELGKSYKAQKIRTKGFAYRPGFHAMGLPYAPHLAPFFHRRWIKVKLFDASEIPGYHLWYLAPRIKLIEEISKDEVDKILRSYKI